jgi:hypothetical protein
MIPRSLRCLLLAVLLLLAQAGAVAHALEHQGDASKDGVAGGVCEWCLAYGHLTDAAPPAVPPSIGAPPGLVPQPVAEPRFIAIACCLAYRSQAPPHFS